MTTQQQEKVHSVAHLRRLIQSGQHDFSIVLAGGLLRSRKTIHEAMDGRFRIMNHIDGSTQTLTETALYTRSNIGKAITTRCFLAQ